MLVMCRLFLQGLEIQQWMKQTETPASGRFNTAPYNGHIGDECEQSEDGLTLQK